MATMFNLEVRLKIEDMLKKNVKIPDIAKYLQCTPSIVYKEIKANISSDDYRRKKYDNYSALFAQLGFSESDRSEWERILPDLKRQIDMQR